MTVLTEEEIINKLADKVNEIAGIGTAYGFAQNPNSLSRAVLPAMMFLPSSFTVAEKAHTNQWKQNNRITGVLFVDSTTTRGARLDYLESAAVPFGLKFRQKFQDRNVINDILDLGAVSAKLTSGSYGAGGNQLTFNDIPYIGWVFEWEIQGVVSGETYQDRALSFSPVRYWPLDDLTGTVARELVAGDDGTYSGVILNGGAFSNGNATPFFNGSSYVDIYSDALAAVYNGDEITVAGWGKANAANVWTDGSQRMLFRAVSTSNEIFDVNKATGNNILNLTYLAGGLESINHTFSETTWFHSAATINRSKDVAKFYVNGSQVETSTGIGTWAGELLANFTQLGAGGQAPITVGWHGQLAHWGIYPVLSDAQIANLATVPNG